MVELTLLRHAEPESAGLYIGRCSDCPLTPRGKETAECIAAVLSTGNRIPEVIFSSPLKRSLETVEPLAGRIGRRIAVHEDLAEIDFGEWEGMAWQDIESRDPELWRAWLDDPWQTAPPGGETLADLQQRVVRAVDTILEEHHGARILIASHGGPIRAILGHALNLDPASYWSVAIDYAAVCRFSRRNPGTLDLLQWNVPVRFPAEEDKED